MIRSYTDKDWEQICEIYDLSKPDEFKDIVEPTLITPLSEDDRMIQYFHDSDIMVYEIQNKVVGFIGQKAEFVSWLFIHPKYRRRGIGRILLKELLNSSECSFTLNLVKTNKVAMELYSSMGFEITKEFQGNMYGKLIPAVRMTLQR